MVLDSHSQGIIKSSQILDSTLEGQPTPSIPCTPRDKQLSTSFGRYTDVSTAFSQPTPNETFSYESLTHMRDNAHQFWSQMSFMDDPNGQTHDWSWDDIDAILRGGSSTQHTALDRRRI